MKRVTRRQACAWLNPLRSALRQAKSGEMDAIDDLAVAPLQGDYARLDHMILGFSRLIERLDVPVDVSDLGTVQRRLANGSLLTVELLDGCLRSLDRTEDELIRLSRKAVVAAATAEQIAIEFEERGLL